MKNKPITFCDTTVHPGECAHLALPLPVQYSCAPLYMPIKVLHGIESGPCLVIFSNLVGNELNGLEIAHRVVKNLEAKDIKGTLIAIPVVNVYGLTHFPDTLPTGGSLKNCFPGSVDGSFGDRMAYLFTEEILKRADYAIELCTGSLNHNILPQVYCDFSHPRAKQLAYAFEPPVITNLDLHGNTLRQTTEQLHLPLLSYQAGEAMRFDEEAIVVGMQGVIKVMRSLEMLPKQELSEEAFKPIASQDEEWILAHTSGILHTDVKLGQMVQQGEAIGRITDPFGADYSENVIAPQEGVVVGINTTPLIHEGLPIFKMASFLDYDKAETVIETWEQS